ncbi:MAG: RagB/SusD family nutrient uptake outer membrane protein [Flavobacteriaceae bacterium]|nr:RagB/SusD family nutrient uptake outer membrane protein [Flavobacteriaceae bacterium]
MKTRQTYLKMKWNASVPNYFLLLLSILGLLGCTDFVEVDPPKNVLVAETVFDDPATVESALADLYYNMRETGMVSGNVGLTTRMALYSDELDYYGSNPQLLEFYQNRTLPPNTEILGWWSGAYTIIYGANAILEGLQDTTFTMEEQQKFRGQALFVRAFMHSLLVAVFGDVPYITSTDHRVNNQVSRVSGDRVHENIISDLVDAIGLMEDIAIANGERTFIDHDVAKALLARMYLLTEQWELAAGQASDLVAAFSLEEDLDRVFLKDSRETIWQLSHGRLPGNTQEANQLIIPSVPGQTFAMSEGLLSAFEPGDQRRTAWVDSISDAENTVTLYYPYKYKARFDVTESLEYAVQFRLAEQFLIRAEALLALGDVLGARNDLNNVRSRAGLPNTTAGTAEELFSEILAERRIELFTEQGHRWFDLKRSGRATELLGSEKPNWERTDVLLPVPESELETNPNLLPQNQGY